MVNKNTLVLRKNELIDIITEIASNVKSILQEQDLHRPADDLVITREVGEKEARSWQAKKLWGDFTSVQQNHMAKYNITGPGTILTTKELQDLPTFYSRLVR